MGLSSEEVSHCIFDIVEESSTGTICRLSGSASAFLLLCLDSVVSQNSESLKLCLTRLLPCVEFSLARQLNLPGIQSKFIDISIKWTEPTSLQLLHFFPSIKVDWNAFSKFLSELKGLPQQFQDILPFLGNFFALNISNPELYGIVDRLARRNPALASAIFHQIVQSDTFPECIEAYAPVFEILVPSDSESVREYMNKISKIVILNESIYSALLKLFPSASAKGKENISKFMADSLMVNKPDVLNLNFLDLASKELSGSEVTLSALIQCAALLNSEALPTFIKTNLKSTQKLSIKSAILLGIAKTGNFAVLSDETLKVVSGAFLKEASVPFTPQAQSFYICSLAALVNRPEFIPDSKLLNDSLQALAKPGGAAVLVEKGWSVFDPIFWFSVNGSKQNLNLIRKHSKCFDIGKAEALAASLEKHLENSSDSKAQRAWSLLHSVCSIETLKSRPLALLCHDKDKLLGLGAGSWAELVRSACASGKTDSFCHEQVKEFIKMGDLLSADKCAFYLLETLISLSPSLVFEELRPVECVSSTLNDLLKFSLSQWSLITATANVKKPAEPIKTVKAQPSLKSIPSTPKSASNDELVVKEGLISAIGKFKHSIMVIRAIALALPFHSSNSSNYPCQSHSKYFQIRRFRFN